MAKVGSWNGACVHSPTSEGEPGEASGAAPFDERASLGLFLCGWWPSRAHLSSARRAAACSAACSGPNTAVSIASSSSSPSSPPSREALRREGHSQRPRLGGGGLGAAPPRHRAPARARRRLPPGARTSFAVIERRSSSLPVPSRGPPGSRRGDGRGGWPRAELNSNPCQWGWVLNLPLPLAARPRTSWFVSRRRGCMAMTGRNSMPEVGDWQDVDYRKPVTSASFRCGRGAARARLRTARRPRPRG